MGLYYIDSWDFALNHKTGKDSKLIKGHLYNFDKKFTYIKLNRIKVSGWYFLGICHLGDNNNLVGYVKSDNSSLKQGRKMPSTRIRWRIIYFSKKVNLTLLLKNIDSPIIFKNIYLFKIPFWFAKDRIIRKIKNNTPLLLTDKTNFSSYWKIYNKLFNPNPSKGNLINYKKWIKIYEQEFKKELDKKKINQINY